MATSYSVRQAVRVAVITAVVVLGIGFAIGVGARDPHAVGYAAGKCMMVCAAFAYAISYLLQTGRKRIAIGAIAAAIAIVVAAVVGVSLDGEPHLRASDRVPLVVDGDRLRHPTLGFSIANPGPGFHEDADKAKAMYDAFKLPDAPVYAYVSSGQSPAILFVMVDNLTTSDLGQGLDKFAAGVTESASANKLAVTTVDRHVTDDEATLHVSAGPAHIRMHAYVRHPARHAAIEVMVIVFSTDEHALANVLDSVR